MASLKTYNSKRDFTKTAEPSGKVGRRKAKALSFVVQKHDATRLHYDFRLALDGVLLSWAVTKGPSTNPADQKGSGTEKQWDEGIWQPIGDPHEGLAKGELKFTLEGRRMHGEWV